MAIHLVILAFLTIPLNLHSKELRDICTSENRCEISSTYPLITNHSTFNLKGAESYEDGIYIQAIIDSFINYGEIITHNKEQKIGTFSFSMQDGKNITNLTNYGRISGGISFSTTNDKTMTINNYGKMSGVSATNASIALNNFGTFNLVSYSRNNGNNGKKAHFHSVNLTIQNHTMIINESASKFNGFDGNATDNSHLVLNSIKSVNFKDASSKLILDFGNNFEFGAGYLFSKLVVDESGNNKLNVDLSRLIPKNDIYLLSQNGEYFIANLAPQYSAVGVLHKANVRTMNNFMTISNSMIYPRKYSKSQNLGKSSLRADSQNLRGNPLTLSSLRADSQNLRGNPPIDSALDSALSLKSYESFAYQNESQNLQTRRIKRPNKRNYSRSQRNDNSVILRERSDRRISNNRDSSPTAQNDNKGFSQNLAQNPHDYYFILTPFINHNLFFESGRYNLSGFDYGFLTAFSARVAESNTLGTHFMMSYGSLGDSHDKDLSIKSMNFMLGLNYKLDLVWDMYLKARGDVFYFLNQVKTLTMINAIKPNNFGFGVSVSYGKDFDFKQGGILGIEGGIDYKALHSNTITLDSMSETYQKSLYNLLYVDLGMSYAKYFGGFGINANLGIKGNITANKLAKSQINLNALNRSVDMVLDNDKILGYANVALSYVLNHKNFDMEFNLAYYGNYGDRVISNGGGFEWRVGW